MDGILLFDKPIGWTSHDAVDFLRWRLGQRSVGHAGTLDPLATGLLLVMLGKATKWSSALSGLDKDYEGILALGLTTDTLDMEGRILSSTDPSGVTQQALEEVFGALSGARLQVPPAYSAVKRQGMKLYEWARRGSAVEADPRRIEIAVFRLVRFFSPEAGFFLTCSKGTYVRSLCHEAGQKLGCGACLSALRRIRIGPYEVRNALTAERLKTALFSEMEKWIIPALPSSSNP